jgi:nicotinamide phosphoribosyltransferase
MNYLSKEVLANIDPTIFDVDSYIISHHKFYPKRMTKGMLYGVARGDASDSVVFHGLQYVLSQLKPPTMDMVDAMREICTVHFGRDDVFNYEGWKKIVALGYYPVVVKAVPEGMSVPKGTALFVIENTIDDPDLGWLPGWFETALVRTWYPTNVATLCRDIKRVILESLVKTGTPEDIDYKLHDFGSRGASVREAAMVGSMAHQSFFKGTDTFIGIPGSILYYGATKEDIPKTIPASAHATITSWGRKWEKEAYRNAIIEYGGAGHAYACVSDSYNIDAALEMWNELEPTILSVGGTLVVRPDSGDPVETPVRVVKRLIQLFGSSTNEKGYEVLPSHVRVIQGDGINIVSIRRILSALESACISADNIAFGMGGALLQQHDRGTHDFAMKMCWCEVDGESRGVYKDPVGDTRKRSIHGRLTTVLDMTTGIVSTRTEDEIRADIDQPLMKVVFKDGALVDPSTVVDIRRNTLL